MTPTILGLSHGSLSVRDRDAAKQFWIDVMGFELFEEQEAFCFALDRASGLAVLQVLLTLMSGSTGA